MTERRRFFPSRPVQTEPGRTVELAVQLRPEPDVAAQLRPEPDVAAPPPAGDPWLSWFPVLGAAPYFGGYWVGDNDGKGLVYGAYRASLWFEGDAPLLFQDWGDVYGPDYYDEVSEALINALPIAQEGWRCLKIHNDSAETGAVYQGILMNAPSGAEITWDLTWSAAPYDNEWKHITVLSDDSPGYIASRNGNTASVSGHVLTVNSVYYMSDGTNLEPETLIAIAKVNGVEVGQLEIVLSSTYA